MNETEQKMLEYMQGTLDFIKKYRTDEEYRRNEFYKDLVSAGLKAFDACAGMFKAVTGKEVTFREWKVKVIE